MIINTILGGLSSSQFLREYWQKQPLLIRNAIHNFQGFLNKNQLISLACRDEIQSRLVSYYQNQWTLETGPFEKRVFKKLTEPWALLVQGVNYFLPEAEALLKTFNFIPHARLDDLMVSIAPNGGGVGPHFDSYDVFLLQGSGKRLWQISNQKNLELLPNAPLRILKKFKPTQEWLLQSGDMLYLPPHYAHHGIAVGECITYSIGFRAPSYQELAQEFLLYLADDFKIDGMYQDPGLKVATHPGKIPDEMINKVSTILKKIRFNKSDIKKFLGQYVSEPKSNIILEAPDLPMSKVQFFKHAQKHGICLALKSRMLFTNELFFMNGEAYYCHNSAKPYLRKLADEREMMPSKECIQHAGNDLYQWYLYGYLGIKSSQNMNAAP